MALIFYLLFVYFSPNVKFSWSWFLIALLFSFRDKKIIYKSRYSPVAELFDDKKG